MKSAITWIQKNLAPTPFQAILSLIGFLLSGWVVRSLIQWGIIDATFIASSMSECGVHGACWAIIYNRWQQFLYGFYPLSEIWRVNLSFLILVICFILITIRKDNLVRKIVILIIGVITLLSLLLGGIFDLPYIKTDLWGGLSLTIFLSLGGIIGAFPLALLLALGRQSDLYIVKLICVTFIEIIRGVPLISVLFMASFMLPLFLPEGFHIDKLFRALVGITFFQAAYLAEVIRGGLNTIPKGQYEASQSLGLNYFQMMQHVILPQALRLIIPGIVNTFIALFKDTTLVMIIGILDFLGIIQTAITDPKWIGAALEAYIFCAFVYWVCCFAMSLYSKHLESKLRIKY